MKIPYEKLITESIKARENSYCPYSKFAVGAALFTRSGKIFTGCNVENAAFSPANCAERTAVFKAVSEGETDFEAIAVCGGFSGKPISEICPPCGVCRQVLSEFVTPGEFTVIMAYSETEYETATLDELLPRSFKPDNLPGK